MTAEAAIAVVDLGELGFDGGASVLLARRLRGIPAGRTVSVTGRADDLSSGVRAWCRSVGHHFEGNAGEAAVLVRVGDTAASRWSGASRAGEGVPGVVVEHAPPDWALAARGAWVEAGGPSPRFDLDRKDQLWAADAGRLYGRAAGSQWDPATAIPWNADRTHDDAVEGAVVQLMAYLVENEIAALVVPSRFLGRVHPHFAEVQQALAVQVADEARHAHVFARRGGFAEADPVLSGAGGRASLATLLSEQHMATAFCLLGLLGEGAFVSLLGFVERFAPDDCTRAIAHLVRSDEARHVSFGMSLLETQCEADSSLLSRLATAIEARHDELANTAGLNQEVFDALVVLAAGSLDPVRIAAGWRAVQDLQAEMYSGRIGRLNRIGFEPDEAARLAALHTRNFM